MAGRVLTTASTLRCPHGGTVSAVTSNLRVKAGGSLLRQSDVFAVSDCGFTKPGGQPSPCITVQWEAAEPRVLAGGPVLDESSISVCMNGTGEPQGAVSIVMTQSRVSAS